MEHQYIIVSLKHSEKDEACFWRSNDTGYTINPWQAGIYSEEQVKANPDYYNDGFNTIAVCITNSSLQKSGLKISINENQLKEYRKKNL
jgi:hypothetical protein